MRTLMYAVICFFVLFCSVYGEETFNSANEETISTSLQKMMMELPQEERYLLQQSVAALYMSEALSQKVEVESEKVFAAVGKKLHGKTAKQIIKMAQSLKIKMPIMDN